MTDVYFVHVQMYDKLKQWSLVQNKELDWFGGLW
jgi:hypothetical protein